MVLVAFRTHRHGPMGGGRLGMGRPTVTAAVASGRRGGLGPPGDLSAPAIDRAA
jgi:hypothetical protein